MIDYHLIFTTMCQSVLQAGQLAKRSQANIQNIGKQADQVSANETERLQAKRSAKTAMDVEVQELLLQAVSKVIDPQNILLDAEEESQSLTLFSNNENLSTSLIIDPIDGTLEYLEGKENYSVCLGMIEHGKVKVVLVYFPIRDVLYGVDPDQKAFLVKNFSQYGFQPQSIILPTESEKIVYKNSRVPQELISQLSDKGFQVLDDTDQEIGCPDAILNIISGKVVAYFSERRQMRDILLGAVIGCAQNGFMSDYQGNELNWLKQGRLPQAVFGNLHHKSKLF